MTPRTTVTTLLRSTLSIVNRRAQPPVRHEFNLPCLRAGPHEHSSFAQEQISHNVFEGFALHAHHPLCPTPPLKIGGPRYLQNRFPSPFSVHRLSDPDHWGRGMCRAMMIWSLGLRVCGNRNSFCFAASPARPPAPLVPVASPFALEPLGPITLRALNCCGRTI